jgi:hypothetical protein
MQSSVHAANSVSPLPRGRDALDAEVDAFNAAFDELDLGWRWDRTVIEALAPAGDDRARVAGFLRQHCAHLLKVYDEAFLVDLIVATKARWGKGAQ